jgi:signal transduction histidine kinase
MHYFLYLQEIRNYEIAAVLIALSLSIIVGIFFSRRISNPIVKTTQIAAAIAQGDYDVKCDENASTAEIAQLSKSLNHLSASLKKQELLRKRLGDDISHELRAPLTAVASHIEMMMEEIWQPTPERLKSCHDEIMKLSVLVKDIEKLTKLESIGFSLNKTQTDLSQIIKTVYLNFQAQIKKKNIDVLIDADSIVMNVDKDRINQALTNLFSNAAKYAREGGKIFVSLKKDEQGAAIVFEDDGIGIDEEDLELIFERFYRTDKSRNRQTGGAGIGLAITKSIINAHKGTIKAQRLNKGVRFIVKLPES